MANLALSHRIERSTVGAFRVRWASHSRQFRFGPFDICSVDSVAGRFGQSGENALIAAVAHLAFNHKDFS